MKRRAYFGDIGDSREPTGITEIVGPPIVDMGTNGAPSTNYAKFLEAYLTLRSNKVSPTTMIGAPRTMIQGYADLVDTTGQPLWDPQMLYHLAKLMTTQIPVDETHGTATDASRIFMGDFKQLIWG